MFSDHTRGSVWTLPILEARHRQRARVEDRLRALEDIGMRNLPFHGFAQNQIWLEVVCLAATFSPGCRSSAGGRGEGAPVRRREPKRLRLRILAVAGRIIHTGRRLLLRLPRGWRHNHLIATAAAAVSTVR
ncbi:transposase [Rhodococcus pyridinivorans]|uniref:transposase n=1 Tax=Rhodococcus pyridinivorans TaxID=103816 RepID=UPI003F4DBE1F